MDSHTKNKPTKKELKHNTTENHQKTKGKKDKEVQNQMENKF